jgi:hypothetical protein
MDTQTISSLSDLQLALLICFLAEQHPIIRAPAHLLDEVQVELEDAARGVFGMTSVDVRCDGLGAEEFAGKIVGFKDDGMGRQDDKVCPFYR